MTLQRVRDGLVSGGGQVVLLGVGQARLGRAGSDDLLGLAVRCDRHSVGPQHLHQLTVRCLRGDDAVVFPQRGHTRLGQHSGLGLVDRQDAGAAAVGVGNGDKMQGRGREHDHARQCHRAAHQCAPLRASQRHAAAEMLFCFYG